MAPVDAAATVVAAAAAVAGAEAAALRRRRPGASFCSRRKDEGEMMRVIVAEGATLAAAQGHAHRVSRKRSRHAGQRARLGTATRVPRPRRTAARSALERLPLEAPLALAAATNRSARLGARRRLRCRTATPLRRQLPVGVATPCRWRLPARRMPGSQRKGLPRRSVLRRRPSRGTLASEDLRQLTVSDSAKTTGGALCRRRRRRRCNFV